jgi:hypothetical protein
VAYDLVEADDRIGYPIGGPPLPEHVVVLVQEARAHECAEGVQHALLGAAQCRGDRRLGGGAAGDGREHGEVEAPVLQATLLAEEPLVLTEQGGGGREDLVDDPGVEVVRRTSSR